MAHPGSQLFTFSTGFSTTFVKKAGFSHIVFHFFHRVFNNSLESVLYLLYFFLPKPQKPKRKKGLFSFFPKESTALKFTFCKFSFCLCFSFSPLEFHPHSFPQSDPRKTALWKTVEKPGFPQKKPSSGTDSVLEKGIKKITSYCEKPALRSGNKGSGCRHPRWW